jgi:hypothetical protein
MLRPFIFYHLPAEFNSDCWHGIEKTLAYLLLLSWLQKKIFPLFSQWKYQKMIRRIKELFESVTGGTGEAGNPVMFFRIGYAPPQKNRTGRRSLCDVQKRS